ncbi:hypothetical protein ACIXC0_05705 [Bacteroides fragilis]
MQGAEGGEYVASNKDGKLTILEDNDPIFGSIMAQGTVPNNRLFRRWVMAQMFHMMSYTHHRRKEPAGMTEMIHRKGYDYQWKMLLNELHAQMKMEYKDITGFTERNRWFNRNVVLSIAEDYVSALKKHVGNLKTKKMQGSSLQACARPQHFRGGPAIQTVLSAFHRNNPHQTRDGRHTALQCGQTVQ